MKTYSPTSIPLSSSYHLLSSTVLSELKVSESSVWSSLAWDIDNPSHGASKSVSRIKWKIPLGNGQFLTDPKHHNLLDWLRRLAWSLIVAPGDGAAPLAPASMNLIYSGLSRVVPWLVEHSVRWPHEITPSVLDHFLSDLPSLLSRRDIEITDDLDEPESLSHSAAVRMLMVFYYIWRQRDELQRSGIRPMPSKPWPNVKGAYALASQISERTESLLTSLPDEVAVPLLNRVMMFIDIPAKDILKLRDDCESAFYRESGLYHTGSGDSHFAMLQRQRNAAAKFQFQAPLGETLPWHKPLESFIRNDGRKGAVGRVRVLLTHLQAACCIILQGLTGMRVSEVCGLRAGINPENGLPVDVEVQTSPTGLNEVFILRSGLSKGKHFPVEVPWLLGSRRVGDTELPTCVQALLTLNHLMAPYRKLSPSDRLLLAVSARVGLPKTKLGISRMTTERIYQLYKNFMIEWVDLSGLADESAHAITPNDLKEWRISKGDIISTHQLRKTYANYVLSVHPKLLPAVKRQFHHMNMSITEDSYWGKSSPQIDAIHSVSRQLTAQLIFEAVQGKVLLGGRMGKRIESSIEDMRKLVEGMDKPTAWLKICSWVEDNGIHATHSNHGACIPVTATRMECWKRSGLRPIGVLEPNYETRDAALCAGCSCYVINANNIPFWRDRYIEHEVSVRLSKNSELPDFHFRELIRRGNMARKLLGNVGIDVSLLEAEIVQKVNSYE